MAYVMQQRVERWIDKNDEAEVVQFLEVAAMLDDVDTDLDHRLLPVRQVGEQAALRLLLVGRSDRQQHTQTAASSPQFGGYIDERSAHASRQLEPDRAQPAAVE